VGEQRREPELRGLTASSPSKVPVVKAMRARDVSRPRADEPVTGRPGSSGRSGSSGSGSGQDEGTAGRPGSSPDVS
jgi:hypothetical protein